MGREATLEIFPDRRVLGAALLEAKRDFLAVIGNPKSHYDYATMRLCDRRYWCRRSKSQQSVAETDRNYLFPQGLFLRLA